MIIFSPLSVEEMEEIVELQMREIRERLSAFDIRIEMSEAARKWLAETGYDPAFGARPLRRALQKYIESPLSIKLLNGDFSEGGEVYVDVEEDKIVFLPRNPSKEKNDSPGESEDNS